MLVTFLPYESSLFKLNSEPIENAINDNAISLINFKLSWSWAVITPSNPLNIRPTDGPKKSPNTKYPDTLGSLYFSATLPPMNPTTKIMATFRINNSIQKPFPQYFLTFTRLITPMRLADG